MNKILIIISLFIFLLVGCRKDGSEDNNTNEDPVEIQDGTTEHPYLIKTKQDLMQMRDRVNNENKIYGNKIYKLMVDIDFAGESSWIPIGTYQKEFLGIFNGNGKVIKNIRIGSLTSKVELSEAGLFGWVKGGEILNLGIEWGCLNASGSIGGITGNLQGGAISNCYSKGLITGGQYAGGIVGELFYNQGEVSNCYSTGDITASGGGTGTASCGGIVGFDYSNVSLIRNCIALNNSLTSISPAIPVVKRIAGYFEKTGKDNYASNTIVVKKGNSVSNLTTITNFTDSTGDGLVLSKNPVDLLNDFVLKNPTQNGISLKKWKVQSTLNDGMPIFDK